MGLPAWVLRPLSTGQVRPVGGSVSLPKVTDWNQANASGPATAGTRHPPAPRPRHLVSGIGLKWTRTPPTPRPPSNLLHTFRRPDALFCTCKDGPLCPPPPQTCNRGKEGDGS